MITLQIPEFIRVYFNLPEEIEIPESQRSFIDFIDSSCEVFIPVQVEEVSPGCFLCWDENFGWCFSGAGFIPREFNRLNFASLPTAYKLFPTITPIVYPKAIGKKIPIAAWRAINIIYGSKIHSDEDSEFIIWNEFVQHFFNPNAMAIALSHPELSFWEVGRRTALLGLQTPLIRDWNASIDLKLSLLGSPPSEMFKLFEIQTMLT